jgi:ribosomal protein L37AE/L43A
MGGRGSGRTASFGLGVTLCDEMHSVDLAWLRRQTGLAVGHSGKIIWSRGGRPTGNISYRVETAGLRLQYRTRPFNGEWRDVNDLIPFQWTDTNFGGRRQWFICPSCQRTCRIIYGGSVFRCRRCHSLRYETQYEPSFARAATRALKIRSRLGGRGGIDDPFPPKPKGMHWRTYKRLRAIEEQLQYAWARGIGQRFRLFDED